MRREEIREKRKTSVRSFKKGKRKAKELRTELPHLLEKEKKYEKV